MIPLLKQLMGSRFNMQNRCTETNQRDTHLSFKLIDINIGGSVRIETNAYDRHGRERMGCQPKADPPPEGAGGRKTPGCPIIQSVTANLTH